MPAKHGAPPLRLRLRDEEMRVIVEVEDAGPGISETDRARAVAPFAQIDPAGGVSGSGLDLAITQRLAEANDSTLELADTPGGSVTARLTLPRDRCPS